MTTHQSKLKLARRPIAQYELYTDEMLRVFASYKEAAKWIDAAIGRKHSSQTGVNIWTALNYGGSGYGFRWKLYDNDDALALAEKRKTKPVEVSVVTANSSTRKIVFPSSAEAARLLDMPIDVVRDNIGINKPLVEGCRFRWHGEYDPPTSKKMSPRGPFEVRMGNSVRVCKSLREVGIALGVTGEAVRQAIDTGRPVTVQYFINKPNSKLRIE